MDYHESVAVSQGFLMARLEISPPTVTRTRMAKDRWKETVEVDMPIYVGAIFKYASGGTDRPMDMPGMDMPGMAIMAPAKAVHLEPMDNAADTVGRPARDTVIGGMKIRVEVEDSIRWLSYMEMEAMGAHWMQYSLKPNEKALSIALSNPNPLADPEEIRVPPLFHSAVTARIMDGETTVDSLALEPVIGEQGLFYGGHLSLPSSDSTSLLIAFTKPVATSLDSSSEARLSDGPQEAAFPGIHPADSASLEGNRFLSNGFGVIWQMAAPETLWVWQDSCCTARPPERDDTHFLRVYLDNYHGLDVNAEYIGYARIRGSLYFEGGINRFQEFELEPFQGETGYYYWTRFSFP